MLNPDSVRRYATILVLLISIAIFSLLAHEVVVENEDWFDSYTFVFLKSWSSPFIIRFFKLLTFFGSTNFLIPAFASVIIFLLFKKQNAKALVISILAVTSTLLLYALKTAFNRSRPEFPLLKELKDFSFPSGHAFSSFVFFCSLAWLIWKTSIRKGWKWLLLLSFISMAILIGVSRIVLRYHYASDVVAGLSLGVAYMLVFFLWQDKIRSQVY